MPGKMAGSDPRPSVRIIRGAGSGQHLASVLQEGQENANIDARLGFIWRISAPSRIAPRRGALHFVRRLHSYSPTSRVRASSASTPRLPDADRWRQQVTAKHERPHDFLALEFTLPCC